MFKNLIEHPAFLLILVVLVVVLFGWKRLPDAARSLGRSSRILKSEIDEMKAETKSKAATETVQGEARPSTTGPASTGATPASGTTESTATPSAVHESAVTHERRHDGV